MDQLGQKALNEKIYRHRNDSCILLNAIDECGAKDITVKGLKAVTGFNKSEMAPLLVELYEVTKRALEIIPALQKLELKTQAKCFELEEKVRTKSGALTLENVRKVVKTEKLTGAVQDLDSKMNQSKDLTEKKWSDIFKSNKEDLKNQKKEANQQRKDLEKTIADNKRQTLVDNLERQKRASNICVSNVAEPTKTDKKEKDEEDRDTIIDILQLNANDVKHVFRAGPVRDKPRPIIIVLASPELANTQHSYGKGRAIRDEEGTNILYWVNPDFIKADRVANYNARQAKSRKSDNA